MNVYVALNADMYALWIQGNCIVRCVDQNLIEMLKQACPEKMPNRVRHDTFPDRDPVGTGRVQHDILKKGKSYGRRKKGRFYRDIQESSNKD